jgi:3-hydroxybutyryl-CoA dehydrogenase
MNERKPRRNRQRVAVIGAGAMGGGIAQLCAQAGHPVSLVDVEPAILERARRAMQRSLTKLHHKGRLAETPDQVLARIRTVSDPEAPLPHADEVGVAIEAVPEDPALKRQVLRALESHIPGDALIATNTSGLPVGELAEGLQRPGRFVGMHFFNPPVLLRVVEVVRGPATTGDSFERAVAFVEALGQEPLPVRRDLPGFVLNRISMAASNEAIRLVEMGVVEPEEVDRGVRGAFGWKMGPLQTADLVGLDVIYAARQRIFERTGDSRFEPPALIRRLVEAGKLGRKTGCGFYEYAPPQKNSAATGGASAGSAHADSKEGKDDTSVSGVNPPANGEDRESAKPVEGKSPPGEA